MKKTLIKIIKRKDPDTMEAVSEQPLQGFAVPSITDAAKEKAERFDRRKLDSTVMRWISERRENGRVERIAALQLLVDRSS